MKDQLLCVCLRSNSVDREEDDARPLARRVRGRFPLPPFAFLDRCRGSTIMELLHLPEEILLLILQAVSVADLARLRQSCRSLNAFVEQAEEVVYRAIASREGFVEQTTCSASAAVVDRPHEHGTESDALKRAIQAQRTMYEYYDDVQSWREFVKRRMLLDRSWRMGEAKEEWIQSPMTGRDGECPRSTV